MGDAFAAAPFVREREWLGGSKREEEKRETRTRTHTMRGKKGDA